MDAPHTRAGSKKNLRTATVLNLVLPGVGQIYWGQTMLGIVWLILFLIFLAGFVIVAVGGFGVYLRVVTSGDVLQPGKLEQAQRAFHLGWMFGFLGGSALVLLLSLLTLDRSKEGRPDRPPRLPHST